MSDLRNDVRKCLQRNDGSHVLHNRHFNFNFLHLGNNKIHHIQKHGKSYVLAAKYGILLILSEFQPVTLILKYSCSDCSAITMIKIF